jgi:hypothetical protein
MKILAITPDRKRDYTTEQTIEGLRLLGVDIEATGFGNGISSIVDDNRAVSFHYDAVFCFFGKVRDNNPPKHYLLPFVQVRRDKIVYIDGSEWTSTGYRSEKQKDLSTLDPEIRRGSPWINFEMQKYCGHYLKRETYPVDVKSGIIPFPFSMSKHHVVDTLDKDIDVMCVFGQNQTGLRRQVEDSCKKMSKLFPQKRFIVSNSLNPDQYRETLARSKIVIDAWGGGDTCDRFYEAVGSKACCLYQAYNIVNPDPYEDMNQAVEYRSTEEFEFKLATLLSDEDLSLKIGANGFDHAKKFHTSKNRAKLALLSAGLL